MTIEMVTVYFRQDGKAWHVLVEGKGEPLFADRFACGVVVPEWWEPKKRHRVRVSSLKKVGCVECDRYLRATRVPLRTTRKNTKRIYLPRVRKSRASTGRKPGHNIQS